MLEKTTILPHRRKKGWVRIGHLGIWVLWTDPPQKRRTLGLSYSLMVLVVATVPPHERRTVQSLWLLSRDVFKVEPIIEAEPFYGSHTFSLHVNVTSLDKLIFAKWIASQKGLIHLRAEALPWNLVPFLSLCHSTHAGLSRSSWKAHPMRRFLLSKRLVVKNFGFASLRIPNYNAYNECEIQKRWALNVNRVFDNLS